MKRTTSADWLRYYGFKTTSEAPTIAPDNTPVRIQQVFGYDPPKMLVENIMVRFCSVCDIFSNRLRFIAEITGGPDWTTDPDWRLSTRSLLAAEFSGRTTKSFDLIFRTDERVEIPGNYQPTRLVLVGTAQRPLNLVPPDKLQTFFLSFSFTDGEYTNVPFDFTVHKVIVPRSYRTSEEARVAEKADQPLPQVDLNEK